MASIEMKSVGLILNGHYTEESCYEYNVWRSDWINNTRKNHAKLEAYKEEYQHDYARSEYDCTGSSCVRIKIQRRGRYIRLSITTTYDV